MALNHDSLSLVIQRQANVPQADKTVTTSNELDLLFSLMFDELLNGPSKVVSKSSVVSAADATNQRQHHTTPLNNHTTPAPTWNIGSGTKSGSCGCMNISSCSSSSSGAGGIYGSSGPGPNVPPPLKGSVSKPKRSIRSSISKSSISIGLQKFRNVSNHIGKGNKGVGGMNEEESDCGESKDEVQAGVKADLMSSLGYSSIKGNSTSKGNFKEGKSLVDRGSKSNAPFSFNNVKRWPSLSETFGIEVNGVNDVSRIRDEAIKEVPVGVKHVSFINVM
nr:hypothetical protein [Tanacetum cinerariifolium]